MHILHLIIKKSPIQPFILRWTDEKPELCQQKLHSNKRIEERDNHGEVTQSSLEKSINVTNGSFIRPKILH